MSFILIYMAHHTHARPRMYETIRTDPTPAPRNGFNSARDLTLESTIV